jgi:NAD(P)-dependent dehydrogenase (short-subunit alcohol dehydrogenase family)
MASKGAILGMTSGLANDLGVYGITVNAVSPGLTRTPGVERDLADGTLPADALDQILHLQAIPRSGTPEDITGLVAFLTGPEAGFITGQFIVADGGMTRH